MMFFRAAASTPSRFAAKRSQRAWHNDGIGEMASRALPWSRMRQKSSSAVRASAVRSASAQGSQVDLSFMDGSAFRFHSLWLHDACRNPAYVSKSAGERILSADPVVTNVPSTLSPRGIALDGDGGISISWQDTALADSTFDGDFLRTYADIVAEPLAAADKPAIATDVDVAWLKPYSGYPGAPAPRVNEMKLWKNNTDVIFGRYPYASLEEPSTNLEMMQSLLRDGAVIIQGVPDTNGPKYLNEFTENYAGALQKDPARAEANWLIATKDNAQSISYNAHLRLNNHTDQSIPSHGAVGLLLAVHYIKGHGTNTLVDGIAVGEALRERDPEAFSLLSTEFVDAERDYIASRSDAAQNHTNSLLISTRYPLLQTDESGGLWRVQYNEVFRTPCRLPYDKFMPWYSAFRKYVNMLHDNEFEIHIEMREGEILLIQNWRVMHGRAGFQSPERTLVGGTITRENFYSKACQLLCRQYGLEPFQVHAQHL